LILHSFITLAQQGQINMDLSWKDALWVVVGAVAAKGFEFIIEHLRARGSKQLRVAGYDEVVGWGWDGIKLLNKLIELDKRVIRQGLNDEREGTAQQWGPVFMRHPESWAILIKGKNEIVGYWHFAALNDRTYARAKSGQLLDSEITLANFEPLELPGTYNLYFVLMGILPEHAARGGRLIEMFFERLKQLAESDIYFREICANAFTEDGVRLCEAFKLEKLRPHADYGTIYHRSLLPFPPALRARRKLTPLAELYEAEYDRMLRKD
jgi:hypothetical protein